MCIYIYIYIFIFLYISQQWDRFLLISTLGGGARASVEKITEVCIYKKWDNAHLVKKKKEKKQSEFHRIHKISVLWQISIYVQNTKYSSPVNRCIYFIVWVFNLLKSTVLYKDLWIKHSFVMSNVPSILLIWCSLCFMKSIFIVPFFER